MDSVGIDVSQHPPRPATRGVRRATFADQIIGDVIPVTTGVPPVTSRSVPGVTFQMFPRPLECNAHIPQTAHIGGMVVGMIDGSVRIVSPSISPQTFWSAVSRDGGEMLGSDW